MNEQIMDEFITDTMAIVLWLEKRKMPQKSKTIFINAKKNEVRLYVPAMVLIEIGYLSEKKKIDITLQGVFSYLKNNKNFSIHNLDTEIIRKTFEIIDIPELHDRIIAASGIVLKCPIITNDPKIIASTSVATIWD
jgi:PIN domain nuclease of toxin-antitoxin system